MSDPVNSPVNFTFNLGIQDNADDNVNSKQGDAPLCIAILSDFSGRGNQQASDNIEQRVFREIDSHDYDDILADFNINLQLSTAGENSVIEVPIAKFKDFHPDQLYKNVSLFSKLSELRSRLNNNATFDDAAKEIRGWLVKEEEQEEVLEKKPEAVTDTGNDEAPEDDLLASILKETEKNIEIPGLDNKTQQTKPLSLVDGFIKQLMANRVKVSSTARKGEMLAAVDEAISESMRTILHHPDFQAVESVWQALRFLVRRARPGKTIKIYLLDITKDEVSRDLSGENIERSGLYKLFCNPVHGDINWSYLVGDFHFDANIDEMLVLSQLGYIAKRSGAVFISSAEEKLVGCESFSKTPDSSQWQYDLEKNISDAWSLLRKSEVAKNISLALPSFLIRTPYSPAANPIKSFSFEETLQAENHDQYLWANAAFLKIEQLTRAFANKSWDMRPNDVVSTEDLPLHTYEENGKTVVKPCTEIALTEAQAVAIQQKGIIPLCSIKNRDRIYAVDFFTLYDH